MSTTNNPAPRSKDYFIFFDMFIDNELSKENKNEIPWFTMGMELENQGIEKTEIFEIIKKDIEDKLYYSQFSLFMSREDYSWHDTYFWIVMKKNKWVKSNLEYDYVDKFVKSRLKPDNIDKKIKSYLEE